jgi:hypothetical protein
LRNSVGICQFFGRLDYFRRFQRDKKIDIKDLETVEKQEQDFTTVLHFRSKLNLLINPIGKKYWI